VVIFMKNWKKVPSGNMYPLFKNWVENSFIKKPIVLMRVEFPYNLKYWRAYEGYDPEESNYKRMCATKNKYLYINFHGPIFVFDENELKNLGMHYLQYGNPHVYIEGSVLHDELFLSGGLRYVYEMEVYVKEFVPLDTIKHILFPPNYEARHSEEAKNVRVFAEEFGIPVSDYERFIDIDLHFVGIQYIVSFALNNVASMHYEALREYRCPGNLLIESGIITHSVKAYSEVSGIDFVLNGTLRIPVTPGIYKQLLDEMEIDAIITNLTMYKDIPLEQATRLAPIISKLGKRLIESYYIPYSEVSV